MNKATQTRLSRRGVLAIIPLASVLPFGSAIAAPLANSSLRGALDASENGVAADESAKAADRLKQLIVRAARQRLPVYLPPGSYKVADLDLPEGARLFGVSGATRLVLAGRSAMLRGQDAARIELSNLVIDGGNGELGDSVEALLDFRGVEELVLDSCEVINSSKSAVRLERCGGRIEGCKLSSAADYGLYAVNNVGLNVIANRVQDCGNGGILIHRWSKGADNSIVTGNRIERVGATRGGTGQFGNAINLFRADNVIVSANHIESAAFSAIRANSASNAQISNNHCLSSGETAIYAEFGFEGTIVAGNMIDGAANGISVVNFNEGGRLATISGNIVRNLKDTGPYRLEEAIFGVGISAEADTAITGNVVEGAPLWGLALGFGPYLRNVVATGNIVRRCGTGCAVSVAEGAGSTVIMGNVFQEVPGGGIVGYRWKSAASGELGIGRNDYHHLTIANNRVD